MTVSVAASPATLLMTTTGCGALTARPLLLAAGGLVLGAAAFAFGRLLSRGAARPVPMGLALALALAAVAEEAFVRRLVYGALLRGGAAVSVVGSAVTFAAVHVTVDGPSVLPLLAAGLVLGWQR